MDLENVLNLEKRTGVRSDDIDSFLKKATAIEEAIRGLKEGTIDPMAAIHIEGVDCDTEEEKARKKVRFMSFSLVYDLILCLLYRLKKMS
jgi:hypothetical protein